MERNGNNRNCGFDDLIVSYIYDEVSAAERRKLEGHLLGCSACTEEFASISNARFSVFEWHKEDFSDLPTPEIVIPYSTSVVNEQSAGIWAGIKALLGGFGMPAFVATALLVTVGAAFLALTISRQSGEQIATNVETEPVRPAPVADKQADRTVSASTETVPVPMPVAVPSVDPSAEPKPVKAVEIRRRKPARQMNSQVAERVQPPPQQQRKAPALSNFDEVDDRSLRLSDLFADEIDTR